MAPATKMQGFGSDSLGLTTPGRTQHTDIHNKPPPKSLWHAASRLASTTWDVVKPNSGDKVGHNGTDARKAAGDVILAMTGNCKYTGKIGKTEDRIGCPCAGCQSWDNETILKRETDEAEFQKALQAKQRERNAQAALEKKLPTSTRQGSYAPPSLSLPVSQPQQRGPWGPAPNERKEERSVEQQSPVMDSKPDLAPMVDLLGGEEQTPPVAILEQAQPVALLDADTADLLGVSQESQDLTSLLVSHAAVDDEDETDLIGLAPTQETKPSEQLDGLF